MALTEFNVTAVVASSVDLHQPESVAAVLDALAGSWPAVAGADEMPALGCIEILVTIPAESFSAAILRAHELLAPIGPVLAFDVMTALRYDERLGFGDTGHRADSSPEQAAAEALAAVPAQPSAPLLAEQAVPVILPVQVAVQMTDKLADAAR